MTCRQIEKNLDNYLAGSLNLQQKQKFSAHLTACTACRERVRAEEKLNARLQTLPKQIQPGDHVWGRIEARLKQQPAHSRFGFQPGRKAIFAFSAGLFIVGALFGASLLTPYLVQRSLTGNSRAATHYLDEFSEAAQAYQAAREQLLTSLQTVDSTIDQSTVTVIEKNINIIDSAIKDIRSAIMDNPGKQQNITKLAELYHSETRSFLQEDFLLKSLNQ